MRTTGSPAELEARRHRAAEHFREQKSLAEVAGLCHASLSSVKRWKKAWKQGGVQALAARRHPGPTCKLTDRQKRSLVVQLKRGPRAAGYRSELWTCRRVAEVVRRKFRVSYHPDHLGRMLHDLGFTPQKPQQVARERDDQAVAHWRRYTWPSLKKRRVARAHLSCFSTKRAFDCNR